MPYIETKIECKNCEYDYGRKYYDSIPELSIDDILEAFDECHNETCGLEICDHCFKRCEDCNESICEDCYNKNNSKCESCLENNQVSTE